MNSLFRQSKTYPFTENLLTALESRLFYKQKAFLLHKSRLAILKSQAFPQAQSFLFAQTFPYHHSKHPFSALHLPLAPSHNLLSAKEHGRSFVVRPKSSRCNARTSHRFKAFSPPFCAKKQVRLVLPENFAEIFFDRALNRGRRTESRVLFGYFLHDAKSDNPFPLQEASRFCEPRISAPK